MSYTLVISSYFYGHLAAHAIESALGQTKPFDKILFVDDNAEDCKHLPKIYPQIDFTLRKINYGIVKNFQDMLTKVDTEYVMFLGADNWLREDTLEILSKSEADIVTYDILVVGEKKNEILQRHPYEITKQHGSWYWDRSSGHHGSMLYKTDIAKEVGGYESPPGRTIEDMVLYHKMLNAGATREHIPEALLYYRRHKENFNPC